jgi:hypothetical protein
MIFSEGISNTILISNALLFSEHIKGRKISNLCSKEKFELAKKAKKEFLRKSE